MRKCRQKFVFCLQKMRLIRLGNFANVILSTHYLIVLLKWIRIVCNFFVPFCMKIIMRLNWLIFKQYAIFSTKQSLAWICTCQIDDQSKLHFNDRWSYSPFITKREEQLASPILVPNTEKKPSCNNVRDMSSNTNGLIEVLDRKIERTVWLAPIWNA